MSKVTMFDAPFKVASSKFTMLAITFIMMALTIKYERDAFVAHVFGVTYQLLMVLTQLNRIYCQMEDSNLNFFYFVLVGGVVHSFVPVVGLFYSSFMYVHVGFCFTVHILHMIDCYMIFNHLSARDNGYIFILVLVNLMEFVANLTYMFPNTVSDRGMVLIFISVQLMALLLSVLKVTREKINDRYVMKVSPYSMMAPSTYASMNNFWPPQHDKHLPNSNTLDTSKSRPTLDLARDSDPEIQQDVCKAANNKVEERIFKVKFVEFFLDRLVLVSVTEAIVLLSLTTPHYDHGTFTVGSGFYFAVMVAKCDHKNNKSAISLRRIIGVFATYLLIGFATQCPHTFSPHFHEICAAVSVCVSAFIALYAFQSLVIVRALCCVKVAAMLSFVINAGVQLSFCFKPHGGNFATEYLTCVFCAFSLIICSHSIKTLPGSIAS
jgi:hypothetical protein